jgi:hypothetical protein
MVLKTSVSLQDDPGRETERGQGCRERCKKGKNESKRQKEKQE